MDETTILSTKYLDSLIPVWQGNLLPSIRKQITDSNYKIIILADAPTGTQTAEDLPVLTQWSAAALEQELAGSYPAFFILTNSRTLPEEVRSASTCDLRTGGPWNSGNFAKIEVRKTDAVQAYSRYYPEKKFCSTMNPGEKTMVQNAQ